jgi:hypothetical protein
MVFKNFIHHVLQRGPGLDHIFIQLGTAMPLPCLLHCLVFLPTPTLKLFPIGNQYDNTQSLKSLSVRSLKPLSSFGMRRTPSINLKIMKVMPTWIFVILTRYCHIPNGEDFPHMFGLEDQAMKKAWEGQGPTEWRCDLARGLKEIVKKVKIGTHHIFLSFMYTWRMS